MRLEDARGDTISEATVVVDDHELVDLLQGLADVVEGKREHLHFKQISGPQLVIRRQHEADSDPLHQGMDWKLGPLVLFALVFIVVGLITVVRWAAGLLG